MFYTHEDCEVLTDLSVFSGGGDVGASDSSWARRYGDVGGHLSLFLVIYSLSTQSSMIHKHQSRFSTHQTFYFICQKVSKEG
jgi:hypothetical protein